MQGWIGGDPADTVADVKCWPPARDPEIALPEREHGAPIPLDYASLLKIANGLTIDGQAIFGTADAFVTDLEQTRWWVIAAMDGEEYVVLEAGATGPVYLWPYDAPDRVAAHPLAPDLRSWLRDSLVLGDLAAGPRPGSENRRKRRQ